MLDMLCVYRKDRRFHAVADCAYGGQSVLNHLPANCHLTSRLLMDARLYDAPPMRKPGTNGRPRKRDELLPTPTAMLMYTLDVLWFAREGHRAYRPLACPWYTSKVEPSFADMLATLKRLCVRQKVLSPALRGPGSRKVQQLLENAYAQAA